LFHLTMETPAHQIQWGKVIDNRRCIGCHACTVACKMEHLVPLGVTRTYVKQVDVGVYPNVRRQFQVTRCNQCDDAPCVTICPVTAMFRRKDGIVDFDRERCIGCKACMAACPYDAIFISPETNSAEKCNFCAHRIDQGLEPACVIVCPERAIVIGDLNDPQSEVSVLMARENAVVRKPEKNTLPKLAYVDASQFTLTPGLATTPLSHAYAEQQQTYPAEKGPNGSTAAAILAYDVPKGPPWDWRVSAYTWTKSIATGAYLVQAALGVWSAAANVVAFVFLLLTGALLIADLKHPERFLKILRYPQWRSWLARGAFIIAGFGGVLALDLIARAAGRESMAAALQVVGIPLAILTAVYTAFLFAQAKGRDLWQSPLLPLHLLTQSVVAGAAVLSIMGPPLPGILAGSIALHLALVLGEAVIPHPTRDGARAFAQMTRGAYRIPYWASILLSLAALIISPLLGGLCSLAALLAYEHAYVQGGQSVPLS
jgi:Fe-S-cluster-containing dehydrogenase component